MNTRIPGDIKKAGDEAFKKAGITPTQVVNAVWKYAAENKHRPNVIKNRFKSLENSEEKKEQRRKAFEESLKVIPNFCKKYNIDISKIKVPEGSNRALRDYLYDSEMMKKYGF